MKLAKTLDISNSTASYHFKNLRDVGLTIMTKTGKNKYVKLNSKMFNQFLPGFLDTLQ